VKCLQITQKSQPILKIIQCTENVNINIKYQFQICTVIFFFFLNYNKISKFNLSKDGFS